MNSTQRAFREPPTGGADGTKSKQERQRDQEPGRSGSEWRGPGRNPLLAGSGLRRGRGLVHGTELAPGTCDNERRLGVLLAPRGPGAGGAADPAPMPG